ncbi:transposase [Dactylosporangium sp. NPDC049742]|uniref:IS110 family transposase n=1 Tax=Dactylosporangium sp. NPDC049742 TaxID=3154737 RepID=UPI003441E600
MKVGDATFPTTATGYRRLLAWTRGFGILDRAGVEGTGSYGAALTQFLRRHQIAVIEVNRPDRAARRRHGKTDTVDAVAAAHAVVPQRATTTAKTVDGPVEILRLLRLARASAVKSRTQTINQLKAVIVSADPALRPADRLHQRRPDPPLRRPARQQPHHIALARARTDQRTRDYLDRRTAQGRTRREAIRRL